MRWIIPLKLVSFGKVQVDAPTLDEAVKKALDMKRADLDLYQVSYAEHILACPIDAVRATYNNGQSDEATAFVELELAEEEWLLLLDGIYKSIQLQGAKNLDVTKMNDLRKVLEFEYNRGAESVTLNKAEIALVASAAGVAADEYLQKCEANDIRKENGGNLHPMYCEWKELAQKASALRQRCRKM